MDIHTKFLMDFWKNIVGINVNDVYFFNYDHDDNYNFPIQCLFQVGFDYSLKFNLENLTLDKDCTSYNSKSESTFNLPRSTNGHSRWT